MPYLMCKNAAYVEACVEPQTEGQLQNPWYKLEFLSPSATDDTFDTLREACISLAITGTHDDCWTSYTIADTGKELDLFVDEEDDEDEEDEEDDVAPTEDFNMADGQLRIVTCSAIKDPRSYFLRIVCSRLQIIVNEWADIVDVSRRGLDTWVSH